MENFVFLVCTRSSSVQCRTLKGAIDTLSVSGYYVPTDLTKVESKIAASGFWEDESQSISIEKLPPEKVGEDVSFSWIG